MKTLPIDYHNQGIFIHKLGHFPIFEKGQGRPSSPPPFSYAPVLLYNIYLDYLLNFSFYHSFYKVR